MPLPVLPPLHLGATTVLLLFGIAMLFLALQKAVVRRAIMTLLPPPSDRPGADTPPATPPPPAPSVPGPLAPPSS